MLNFLTETVFWGAIFLYIEGFSYLAYLKSLGRAIVFTVILYISVAFLLHFTYLNTVGFFFETALLNHLFVPFVFFVGPMTHLAFKSLVNPGSTFNFKGLAQLAPGVIVLLGILCLTFVAPHMLEVRALDYFQHKRHISWLEFLFIAGFSMNLLFYFLILRNTSMLFNVEVLKINQSAQVLLAGYVSVFILTSLVILSFVLAHLILLLLACFIVTVLAVAMYFFAKFYPDSGLEIETTLQKTKYQQSRIVDVDLKETHLKLIELMVNEKLYQVEDLSLASLASELGLKSYQLSEFLNKYLDMNFSRFINQFRVEKAIRMLDENPDASLLEVAYKVGFASKGTFNYAFKSIKGKAPSDYVRKKK